MYLIEQCVCGRLGPFAQYVFRGLSLASCDCGVSHQLTTLTREAYEQQYLGEYHIADDRHPGCVPYRERYEHDLRVAKRRIERYRGVHGVTVLRTALDVGCATGAFVDALRMQGVEAYGIDPDPGMRRDHVLTGSIADAPAGPYDLITFHDVLEHLVDPIAALRAARDRLSPGGMLIVDVPDVSVPAGHHHYKAEHLWYFTAHALVEMALDLRFVGDRIDYPIPGKLVLGARRPAETLGAVA